MKSQSTLFQGAKRLNNVLLGIETFFMALITIALVAAIFIEVICRYFLFISAAWAEELTRYLFIWLTYIGSAYAVYEGSHTEIDQAGSCKFQRTRPKAGAQAAGVVCHFVHLSFPFGVWQAVF